MAIASRQRFFSAGSQLGQFARRRLGLPGQLRHLFRQSHRVTLSQNRQVTKWEFAEEKKPHRFRCGFSLMAIWAMRALTPSPDGGLDVTKRFKSRLSLPPRFVTHDVLSVYWLSGGINLLWRVSDGGPSSTRPQFLITPSSSLGTRGARPSVVVGRIQVSQSLSPRPLTGDNKSSLNANANTPLLLRTNQISPGTPQHLQELRNQRHRVILRRPLDTRRSTFDSSGLQPLAFHPFPATLHPRQTYQEIFAAPKQARPARQQDDRARLQNLSAMFQRVSVMLQNVSAS